METKESSAGNVVFYKPVGDLPEMGSNHPSLDPRNFKSREEYWEECKHWLMNKTTISVWFMMQAKVLEDERVVISPESACILQSQLGFLVVTSVWETHLFQIAYTLTKAYVRSWIYYLSEDAQRLDKRQRFLPSKSFFLYIVSNFERGMLRPGKSSKDEERNAMVQKDILKPMIEHCLQSHECPKEAFQRILQIAESGGKDYQAWRIKLLEERAVASFR